MGAGARWIKRRVWWSLDWWKVDWKSNAVRNPLAAVVKPPNMFDVRHVETASMGV
jgi:hypothetical protein